MSKLFWGVLMIFSLIITAWSGLFVYNELQTKDMNSVPLTPVTAPTEPLNATPSAESSTATLTSTEIAISTTPEPTTTAAVEQKEKPKRINGKEVIEFKFKNSTAKKVSLVGDFNKWFRQAMKRTGDEWTFSIPLAPGKYQYVFVVDDGKSGPNGKRVTDPNNTQKSKDGKLSLLIVQKSNE